MLGNITGVGSQDRFYKRRKMIRTYKFFIIDFITRHIFKENY